MSPLRGFAMLAAAAAAGGGLTAVVYGAHDGRLTAVLLLLCGVPVIALSHVFARRQAGIQSLTRKFTLGISLAIGLVLVAVGVVAALMFVSPHDAFLMAILLAFAGFLAAYCASLLARGLIEDIRAVRDGVVAVGHGRRAADIVTGSSDEVGDLAKAANRMTEQLSVREEERDAAEDARRGVVAAVSHDLRTPLTSLRLLAEAIEDDLVDADTRRRYVGQMSVHIRSLSALIDDLFELSRLQAGDIQWSMQQVRLDELIEDTVEAMRPHADAKMVMVEARVTGGAVPAHANPEKLQRVLFNLIQNAIRHTPPDGSVTVAAESKGSVVEVEVADTGEGLPAEERERAFEPFYRGGDDEARSGGGSGLGLTICRAIVEAHGGMIWFVESRAGTRVRFCVPAAP